ncbi:hypothetical protein [Massiliimalia massiliensis]|uniref:hypothetical protein n=1 Tax=Massiliimalia massiliensis TaxID=1852384 RepID=UPI000984ED52|nr:hypothetical protein [Massiliimalia massiliensis]
MDFKELNLTELDKNLSEEQQKEWNSIYASYRAKSILTGRVCGMDMKSMTVLDPETGASQRKEICCLVIISYRVKVLIPEQEIWYSDQEKRPIHVLRSMAGATIDYVITNIDRENECCTASRKEALQIRRHSFLKLAPEIGRKIPAQILAVGRHHLLCSCHGFDITLSQRDLSYAMLPDLRERYHPGETYMSVIKNFEPEKNHLTVSVKEAEPHPFDGADLRHPVGSRRASVITGKYKGGVFCKLEKNLDCMCIYSPDQYDENFDIGDQVIVVITKFNYRQKLVYGKIVAKW